MFEDVAGLPPFRPCDAPSWLSTAHIRRAVRSGDLVVGRRGVLVGRRRLQLATEERDSHLLAIQVAAAGLRGGSPAYACLGSAAVVHQLSRLGRPPQRVRLYREKGGPWRDEEVAVLCCGLPGRHVQVCEGVPATTRARTTVDLARWVTFRSGVVVADSALRRGCTRAELERVVADCTRWPGIRRARDVVAFADGRSESPLESISRVAIRDMGLPAPELQVGLGGAVPVGIVDFYWEDYGVVGEADGMLKYDDDEKTSLREEKLRQEALEDLGLIVVRWTWEQIWRQPDWVAMRLRRAFRQGAQRRS
jgi:very-short-patch-repair endonuclease